MMTMILAAAAAAAAASTPAKQAPQGFESLTASAEAGPLCTADKVWCVSLAEGAPLIVTKNGKGIANWTPGDAYAGQQVTLVPGLLRLADGSALVGVQTSKSLMYSGGGGSIEAQGLIHVQPGKAPALVLAVPSLIGMTIRACFSEKDMNQRAGACHDEYELAGELAVAGRGKSVVPKPIFPDLTFTVATKSFPRGVSLDVDSLTLPPLTEADLVWEADAACTYQRTFRFDAASGEYAPETPLPDCSQYTDR